METPSTQPRITDLSSITAETIKKQNTELWRGDTEYDPVFADHHTRRMIWSTRNGDLRRLFYDFPIDAPIHEQCAAWVHAVAGKHFFPDANHRTAILLLRELLRENGIVPGRWPADITRATSIRSHEVRAEIPNIRLDNLYERDRLFLVWLLYFKIVLRVTDRKE